jgi:hypothetical protein
MPRFYFDVIDDEVITDEEGQELPSSAAAIFEAHRSARELAAAQVLEGQLNFRHRIVVRTGTDTVAEVAFGQAVLVVS